MEDSGNLHEMRPLWSEGSTSLVTPRSKKYPTASEPHMGARQMLVRQLRCVLVVAMRVSGGGCGMAVEYSKSTSGS